MLSDIHFFVDLDGKLSHPWISLDGALGSTAVRITEEYIYCQPQRNRIAYFIELMEMLNHHSKPKNWLELLPGKWQSTVLYLEAHRLNPASTLCCVIIVDVNLMVSRASKTISDLSFTSDVGFTVMIGQDWSHDKTGITGKLEVDSVFRLTSRRRLYIKEEKTNGKFSFGQSNNFSSLMKKISGKKWRKAIPFKDFPSSLPVAKLVSSEIKVKMNLGGTPDENVVSARDVIQEARIQVPTEMFDLSKIVCGTCIDSRVIVLSGV